MFREIKTFLLGKPLQTEQMHEEKLPKWKALAIFSSDALSSVAYATQEILIPLSLVSFAATSWSLPIASAIGILLLLVSGSYWQTIKEYPSGGGAYIVARENLGTNSGLVAGAALLIDYVLTASVSAAAGVEAITSAFPELLGYKVVLGCLAITVVTLVNLRGVRETGNVFSIPTYLFIFSFFIMILVGAYRVYGGWLPAQAPLLHESYPSLNLFLILKAFSSGCAALTGIEAISNGTPAFRSPSSKNARVTLIWMVLILGALFMGITALSHILKIIPNENETVVSQLARLVFNGGPFYYLIQASTALILFLAANTSFADFPRVCSILANDRFLPRQLASLGDRLVFSKGIFLLGLVSGTLLVIFQGTTHYLIPLYAVGVFLSFTLSQAGMVRHHWTIREKGWKFSIIFSFLGALATFVVSIVIASTKFIHGAWIVIVLIPILVFWFRATREHYRKVAAQLTLVDDVDLSRNIKHVVVLPVSGVHKGVIDAIKYAKSISHDVRVVYVELDEQATERMKGFWNKLNTGLPLVVLSSPYRSVVGPIVDYIRSVDKEAEDDMLTVVIPEFVTARWWEGVYHNQTAFLIKTALLFEKGKVVTSVRYHLSR
jgi:amino acid transporter